MLKLVYTRDADIHLECREDDCDWLFLDPQPDWFEDWWEFHALAQVKETGHAVRVVSEVYITPEDRQ